VEIRAREIRFVPGARIGGDLTYYTTRQVDVPAAVIDRARVHANVNPGPSLAEIVITVVMVLAIVLGTLLLLALILALAFPRALQRTRRVMSAHPWRNLLFGVLMMGALFGSVAVLAMSLIGIPLIPLVLIVIPFALIAGYLTTAHAIGSKLLRRAQDANGGLATFGATLLGLLVLLVLGIIPVVGWIIGVLAVIAGLGAWFGVWFAPRPPQTT